MLRARFADIRGRVATEVQLADWEAGKRPPHAGRAALDAAGAGASVRVTVTKPQQGMPRHDGHIGATWEADYRIGSSAPM